MSLAVKIDKTGALHVSCTGRSVIMFEQFLDEKQNPNNKISRFRRLIFSENGVYSLKKGVYEYETYSSSKK